MKKGFTFLELLFVIIVMGLLANFGTNILVTTYENYSLSTTNNKILTNVELTLKQISNRLQYRIKDSVIARGAVNGAFTSLSSAPANSRVLEWVGYDIDGWLGTATNTNPTWSGFIDVNDPGAIASQSDINSSNSYLESPGSNTANIFATIAALDNGGAAAPAIFFSGANTDVTQYGWGGAIGTQNQAAHEITGTLSSSTQLATGNAASFTGVDIYENYKLAWTAYSISLEDFNGDGATYRSGPLAGTVINDLVLYYDYQPWAGGTAPGGVRRQLLLQNVDTFDFQQQGEVININICVNQDDVLGANDGGYSVCEEIAIL